MNAQQYHEDNYGQRSAVIVTEGRKWMTLLVVSDGRLKLLRRPLTEQRYMTPLHGNDRKLKATLRRLARKRGTPKIVRQALKAGLEVTS